MDNKFDPERLKLSQNFGDLVGVKKHIVNIPVRKPNKQEFVRTHKEYSLETGVLVSNEDQETYMVDPSLYSELSGIVVPKILYLTINRNGTLILWPIRLPDPNGRHDTWNQAALSAAEKAKSKWFRIASNQASRTYDVLEAAGNYPEPEWPDISFKEILKLAFQNRMIESLDHPLLRKLRGEI